MILKKLHLTSFGKFFNRTVELEDGLNLVYGGNEAGKTTLHKFIEGMFFGFFKQYSRNKIYSKDYEKYYPWDAQSFKGSIEYEAGGKLIRLERSFDKNSESVRLYDIQTGDDITNTLEFDPVQKIPLANKHLGVNLSLFRNTISIGQMANVTDEDLAKEIGDLLANTEQTMSADVSFRDALNVLEDKKSLIGTKRQLKSPYGKASTKLEGLMREKQHYLDTSESNRAHYHEIEMLDSQLRQCAEDKQQLKKNRRDIYLSKVLKRHELYLIQQKTIAELQEKLNDRFDITDDDYDLYNQTNAEYHLCIKNAQELTERQITMRQRLTEARGDLAQFQLASAEGPDKDEMIHDSVTLEKRLEKIEAYKRNPEPKSEATVPNISKKFKAALAMQRSFRFGTIIAFVLAVASLISGFFVSRYFWYAAAFLGSVGLVLLLLLIYATFRRNKLEPIYERHETTLSRTYNTIIMYEIDVDQLKKKYKCADVEELIELFDGAKNFAKKVKEYESRISNIEALLNDMENEQARLEQKRVNYEESLHVILARAGVKDSGQLKAAINIVREREVLNTRLEAALNAARDLLDDLSPAELEAEAAEAKSLGLKPYDDNMKSQEDDLDTINAQIVQLNAKIAEHRAVVTDAENMMRPLSEIEEEIISTQKDIMKYEEDIEAITLAAETIKEISHDIHINSSDTFNEYVSDVINKVTDGKYKDVKVNEKMEIMVLDNEQGKLANVESLSAGTIDQLYFAVRFAVMDLIIADKSLPVFLDDCFLQYDDERLENILSFISSISNNRQVVIFTCRRAEKNAVDKFGIPHNYLEL